VVDHELVHELSVWACVKFNTPQSKSIGMDESGPLRSLRSSVINHNEMASRTLVTAKVVDYIGKVTICPLFVKITTKNPKLA